MVPTGKQQYHRWLQIPTHVAKPPTWRNMGWGSSAASGQQKSTVHWLPPCRCRFITCTKQRISGWYSLQVRCIYLKPKWWSWRDLQALLLLWDRLNIHRQDLTPQLCLLAPLELSAWREAYGLQGTGLPFQLCSEKIRLLHFQHCTADACCICSSSSTEYSTLKLFSKLQLAICALCLFLNTYFKMTV